MTVVLLTGATGEVGRGVVPFLEKDFDLRLLSLDAPGTDPRRIQADVLDRAALAQAMRGVDAVLHLAVAPGHSGTYEDDRFNDRRFDVNVKGTFHMFETARRLRIRRVVHVSSVMVTWGHGLTWALPALIPGDAPPLPAGSYALCKTLAEGIARHFATEPGQEHRLEVITVRITAPLDLNDPEVRSRPVRPQQVPFADLAQAFRLALTVPLAGYEIVTVAGLSSRCPWDLEPARRILGYQPHYNLDELGLTFAPPFEVTAR